MVNQKLMTRWGSALDRNSPLSEYPRPQLQREQWLCLNGVWDYAMTDGVFEGISSEPSLYDGEIVVPFSLEALLSGVEKQLLPGNTLWYRRVVNFGKTHERQKSGSRLMLNFGAVDQRCEVFVNGHSVGSHEGGYWPFGFDITDVVCEGDNRVVVAVVDDSDSSNQAWGKQRLNRGGIWYTAQSGIWQTVWSEWVPKTYISQVRLTPQWRHNAVDIEVSVAGEERCEASVHVRDDTKVVASGTTEAGALRLKIADARSWSPDDPFLYTVEVRTTSDPSQPDSVGIDGGRVADAGPADAEDIGAVDTIHSYFGMREFSTEIDRRGNLRPLLNGKPIFHTGLLDQGYWSDGLYTAPSDEAMVWELKQLKTMGFNMLRKHIKVEPLRWYYHCDRLGIMVWQDCVSGGGPYKPLVIQALPFMNINLRDSHYALFGSKSAEWRRHYVRDLRRTVATLYNVTSIAVWVPFNEGWGQFDALKAEREIRRLDGTRLVDHASGWHDQGGGDFTSRHIYYKHFRPRGMRRRKDRVLALTEFGGFSLPSDGHMSSNDLFGYKVYRTGSELMEAIEHLYQTDVEKWVQQGLSVSIYTQVSDVEDEINGLFSFDRAVVKVDGERIARMNERLKNLMSTETR